MTKGVRSWLTVCLIAGSTHAWGSAEIHVSSLGNAPSLIEFRFEDKSPTIRMEVAHGFIMQPCAMPGSSKVRLYGPSEETSPEAVNLGEIDLPAKGRHLLLISQTESGKSLVKMLPFDSRSHPPGGVGFLNLTSRKIRCSLNTDSVELAPCENKLHPNIDQRRRIVNHRLQSWDKEAWKAENSTTVILGANNRFLFVFFQDKPDGEIRRKLVTDFDPERNLAPVEPAPVKAEPPLPDPPAK